MLRAAVFASLLFLVPPPAAVQDGRGLLRVTVAVADGTGASRPVGRHVLLVSDSPPTAPPRRLQTALDGTASVRLPPGTYTVESEQPVAVGGKTYEWVQAVDVAPGRESVLELTAANAEVSDAVAAPGVSSTPLAADAPSLLTRWQDSVFAVWSPTARGSGFLADARGLVVTTQRAVGPAAFVEVELSPRRKVMAVVLAADPVRDVAVLAMDPAVAAAVAFVPLGCAETGTRSIEEGEEVLAIGAPLGRGKTAAPGMVLEIEGRVMAASLVLAPGGAGGPVFSSEGRVVGIASVAGDDDEYARAEARVVRVEEACAVVASAEQRMAEARVPDGTLRPVEPERPFPFDALKGAAGQGAFSLGPYRMSSSSYDLTFITPALLYAAENRRAQPGAAGRRGDAAADPRTIDPLDDFSNWAEYVAAVPPVLMIRATPRLVEGFWTKVARGAAQTQGMSIPPIKRFKPGFGRLQAFCGDVEVLPVHPFKLEQRVSESDAIYEGLYVFAPDAIGPACGTVRLVLYSEDAPGRGDTRVVDRRLLQRVWDDFAPYRAQP